MNELPDATWVRAFLAVADQMHFGRAAMALHVTQSTVSHRVRRLEETLDVELFDRSRRQVTLTTAGEAFLRRVRPALLDLERAMDEARAAARSAKERLVVGYTGSLTCHPLMSALVSLVLTNPGCRVETRQQSTHDQLVALRSGAMDVGSSFVEVPPTPDDIEELTMEGRPLWLLVPEAHPFVGRAHVSWNDMRGERFILLSATAEPAFRTVQDRLRNSSRAAIEVDAVDIALTLVAEGVGVTILPSVPHFAHGLAAVSTRLTTSAMRLFWHRRSPSHLVRAIVESLRSSSRHGPG